MGPRPRPPPGSFSLAGRLTQTGVSIGAPQYVSPEQATGASSVGAASDVLEDPVRRDTVLSTPGFEYNASLSRDGSFVAYQTYEAGPGGGLRETHGRRAP